MKKKKSSAGLFVAGVAGVALVGGGLFFAFRANAAEGPKREKIDARQWPVEMLGARLWAKANPTDPETFLMNFVVVPPPQSPPGTPMRFVSVLGPWIAAQRATGKRIFVRKLSALLSFEISSDPRVSSDFAELVFSI